MAAKKFIVELDTDERARLTADDLDIIRRVGSHRFLRSTHLVKLIGRPADKVLRRLSALYHHGYPAAGTAGTGCSHPILKGNDYNPATTFGDVLTTNARTSTSTIARLPGRPSSAAAITTRWGRLTAASGAHAGWRVGSTNHVVYVSPRTMGVGVGDHVTVGRQNSSASAARQVADNAYHSVSVSPTTSLSS